MDEKISLDAIALYAHNYSDKVIRAFFTRKEKIAGAEILSFSNVQQVNLLIIKEVFKAWKEERKKIESPYFDYTNEEVNEAMENLMNILSRNILISQDDFTPLVRKAVTQALLVIFSPYDFFAMLLTGPNNQVDVGAFREEIKYLRVNKAPLEKMLQKMEAKNAPFISGNEALGILDGILEEVNFTPEDVEQYIEKFSIVAPLDPNKFFITQSIPPPPPPVVRDEPRVSHERTNHFSSAPGNRPTVPPVVNEKVNREQRPSLADNFQKIRKIKESLTINQKFMFTKVLFHGDFELFSRAIDRLDQFDNLPSALRYIEEEHATTWDRDSEEFHEFMELVEKRFA